MNDIREKEYLIQLRGGSYKAFRIIYEQYSAVLYRFILDVTHDKMRADEIVQETFVKIWLHRDRINPDQAIKSYIFKIAKNLVVDEFRKKMRNPMLEDFQDHQNNQALAENTTDQKLDLQEFHEALQQAKGKLTPRQREIFEMSKEEGLSTKEIAAKLKILEQSVYNQLSNTLERLKKEINKLLPLFLLFF
ncbi:MAG: RNA polymerase sigma-70 factor [Breznakibacter sp.]|nr:RNA polymerase sigma-70 factor [Breznakibacter sp.]